MANAQRKLARQIRGSANWRKTKDSIARLYARAANARLDFLHKTSLDVAKNHGIVAIEKLQVRSMSRSAKGTVEAPGRYVGVKRDLNRLILDKRWGTFAVLLRYKLEYRGGELIEVPAPYTSLTCAECGVISRDSRKSQPEFVCIECGHSGNADTNAACNVLRVGHTRRVGGSNRNSGRKQELAEGAVIAPL